MENSPYYFWLASTRGPLRVRYAYIAGAVSLDASGFKLESGLTVSWRDLASSDRVAVTKRMLELRQAVSA